MFQLAEGKRLTRFDRQLPEADFTQLVEHLLGVVGFTDRDATAADHHIGLAVCLLEGGAQRVLIITDNAQIQRFAP
ncbi:hypothetical protein D3C87_1729600 [compost metagenome]